MDAKLQRKEFVSGLISVLSLGIDKNCLDDSLTLLTCVRRLRPKVQQFDTFEAWILMKRRELPDAMRILRNLDAAEPDCDVAKAFIAMCQYLDLDPAWRDTATRLVEHSNDVEAIEIAQGLLDDTPPAEPDTVAADTLADDPMRFAYMMRA